MATRQKSSEDLTDSVMDIITDIRPAAVRETREGLAERLAFLGRGTTVSNKLLADCHTDTNFQVTDEFLAGMRFAAELVGDPNFDI